MNSLTHTEKRGDGFTLLELLIVISIIAVLSIALVFMLNPAETLKKSRDAQRISDLKTVKTALGVMLTSTTTPILDSGTAVCTTNTTGGTQTAKIAYSSGSAPTVTSTTAGSDSVVASFNSASYYSQAPGKVDGTGWIPTSLKGLTSGSPIASFPVDPVNTVTSNATSTDLVYRYACQNLSTTAGKPSYVFEIDTQLESNAYTVDNNLRSKDGGDNDSFYETGNDLNLLPTSTGF